MTVINTNLSAVAAQNSLRTSALNQTTAMERLSSGIRINSAKDDAAGLAISTRMTANIRGLSAAIRNANDGISLTQTAEGSLSSIGDNLQRIRELAVQSANTGNNDSDRAALNTEARQLVSEIDRIANNSQFNGIKLLDGSFQNQSLQVGAGNDSNDRISISIGSAKVSALGIGSNSSYARTLDTGGKVTTAALTAGALSINGAQIGESQSDGVSYDFAAASAIAKAAAINAASGLTGVTATVSSTKFEPAQGASSFKGTQAGDILINGVDIGPIAATYATPQGTQTQQEANSIARGTQVAAAINAKASQTGVIAVAETVTGGSGDTATIAGRVRLVAADGRNITVKTTSAGAAESGLATTTATVRAGVDVPSTVAGFDSGELVINGVSIGAVSATTESTPGTPTPDEKDTHATKIIEAINAKQSATGVLASLVGHKIVLTAANGGEITVEADNGAESDSGLVSAATAGTADSTAAAGTGARSPITERGRITLSTNGDRGIVIGGTAGAQSTGQTVGFYSSILSSSGGVDLSTATGSQAALSVLDKAINTVTDTRASMGAYQNRLTASVANLEITSMNLQASRSRILDTDYAKETTNLAKAQIIQQAATAMLAQANQSSQSVLSLLK
jgi:flagellin